MADGHEWLNAMGKQTVKEPVENARPSSFGSASMPVGKMRLQAMEVRKQVKPISAKRSMSSS